MLNAQTMGYMRGRARLVRPVRGTERKIRPDKGAFADCERHRRLFPAQQDP